MKKLNLPELLIEKEAADRRPDRRRPQAWLRPARVGHALALYLRIADDDNLMTHQRFIAEMVRRGCI
ncbi:MAG: hypothetical protein ACLUE4_09860 [Acutalibacteraceae bacterium]